METSYKKQLQHWRQTAKRQVKDVTAQETSYKGGYSIGDKLQEVFTALEKVTRGWRQVTRGAYSIGDKLQEVVTALETSYKRLLQHWRQVTRGCYSKGDKLQEVVTAFETSHKRLLQHWRLVTRGGYSIENKLQEVVTVKETSYKRMLQQWRQVTRVVTTLETSYKRMETSYKRLLQQWRQVIHCNECTEQASFITTQTDKKVSSTMIYVHTAATSECLLVPDSVVVLTTQVHKPRPCKVNEDNISQIECVTQRIERVLSVCSEGSIAVGIGRPCDPRTVVWAVY